MTRAIDILESDKSIPTDLDNSSIVIAVICDRLGGVVATKYFRSKSYRARCFNDVEAFIPTLEWSPEIHCVISNVRVAGVEGAELVHQLRSAGVKAPIALTATATEMGLALKALKAGASEILQKPYDLPQLEDTVKAALRANDSSRSMHQEVHQARMMLDRLTTRQKEVVELIARGLTSKEIGAELDISYRTVEAHRLSIMAKLSINTLSELIRLQVVADLGSD